MLGCEVSISHFEDLELDLVDFTPLVDLPPLEDLLLLRSSVVGELVKRSSIVGELVLVDLLPKDLLLEDLPKSWLLEDLLQLVFVDLTPLEESDPLDLDDLLLLRSSVVGESVIG